MLPSHTPHPVISPLEPLVSETRWSLVERRDGGGPGVLATFDARGRPEAAAGLARAAALSDPRLVAPIEHGVRDGAGFALYPGTLEDSLANSSGPLALADLADFADALLTGVGRAHLAGLVHPGIGRGLVRLAETTDGQVAPEVLGLGLPTPPGRTAQDDLTDVAALVYELFAARPPYPPGAPTDGSTRVSSFAEVRPSTTVPLAFEAAVLRQLGPRAGRFQSAAGMRAALLATPVRRTAPAPRPGEAMLATSQRGAAPESLPTGESVAVPLAARPRDESRRDEASREEGPRARQVGMVVGLMALSIAAGIALVVATAPRPERAEWTATPTLPSPGAARDVTPPREPAPAPAAATAPASPSPRPKAPKPTIGVLASVDPPAKEHAQVLEHERKPEQELEHAQVPATAPATAPAHEPQPAPTPAPQRATAPATAPQPEPAHEPEPQPATAAPAAPEPAPAPSSPAPAMRRVRITTTPDGVRVLVHGKLLGVTPLATDVPVADLPLEVVFEKAGYRTSKKTLVPVDDLVVDLQLEADRPASPPNQ